MQLIQLTEEVSIFAFSDIRSSNCEREFVSACAYSAVWPQSKASWSLSHVFSLLFLTAYQSLTVRRCLAVILWSAWSKHAITALIVFNVLVLNTCHSITAWFVLSKNCIHFVVWTLLYSPLITNYMHIM